MTVRLSSLYFGILFSLLIFSLLLSSIVANFAPQRALSQAISSKDSKIISSHTNATNNFLSYRNPTYGITMQYPSNWRVQSGQNSANNTIIDIAYITPPVANDPRGTTNLQIGIDNSVLSNITSKQYLRNLIDNSRNSLTDFRVLAATNNTILSGLPASSLLSIYKDPNSGLSFETMEINAISNNHVYYIHFITEPSMYSTFLPTLQKMINTFKVNAVATKNTHSINSPTINENKPSVANAGSLATSRAGAALLPSSKSPTVITPSNGTTSSSSIPSSSTSNTSKITSTTTTPSQSGPPVTNAAPKCFHFMCSFPPSAALSKSPTVITPSNGTTSSSSIPSSSTSNTQLSPLPTPKITPTTTPPLSILTDVAKDPIRVGMMQTITVTVLDVPSNQTLANAYVDGKITGLSGSTTKTFGSFTDNTGKVTYSWKIGSSSIGRITKHNTYAVKLQAYAAGHVPSSATRTFVVNPGSINSTSTVHHHKSSTAGGVHVSSSHHRKS
jgi:photosystem II reaction center protein PsbP